MQYTMNYTFFRTAFVLLTFVGFCGGTGVITDFHRGITGENVTFKTSVKPTAEPFLAVTWAFNHTTNIITSAGGDVVGDGYKNRVSLDKSTGSLVLSNLTEKDSGEYELIIITPAADQIHGITKLKVHTKVSMPTMPCNTKLIEGRSVNLTCDAEHVSAREWMKDGQPLGLSDRFTFYDGNRVLSISPVDRTDTGQFICNVSNTVSFKTATCEFIVNHGPDKPIIIQEPIGAELEEAVTLRCSADSLPEATFTWTFRTTTFKGPVYEIYEMEEKHLGMYTCTAHNAVTGQEDSVVHTLRDSSDPIRSSMMVCTVLTLLWLMLI